MGSIVCCECCGRLEAIFRKPIIRSDSESASLLQDSSRRSSSSTQDSSRGCYGTLHYHQQEISAEANPEELDGKGRHDSEEDEGICECEKVPLPCSENSSESSHAFSAFHSDLLVGMAEEQGPPLSLLACATPLNFAAQQLERTGAAADPPLNLTQTHTGSVEEQSTSDGYFASLGSSFNCKGLKLATQCHRSILDGQGLTCIVVKGIPVNPSSTIVLDPNKESPHEKLCAVCMKNITPGEKPPFFFSFGVKNKKK